jgi:hypothetical protein
MILGLGNLRMNDLPLYVEQEEIAAIRETRWSVHLFLSHEKKLLSLSVHIVLPYAEWQQR